jgi:hypothetical protein
MKSSQTLYVCPDGVVEVIRKSTGLRRYPPSDYPCLLFVLRPKNGTRVRLLPGGNIEYMPSFDELKSLLVGLDPSFEARLPANFHNKPRSRQQKFKRWNKDRHNQKWGRP